METFNICTHILIYILFCFSFFWEHHAKNIHAAVTAINHKRSLKQQGNVFKTTRKFHSACFFQHRLGFKPTGNVHQPPTMKSNGPFHRNHLSSHKEEFEPFSKNSNETTYMPIDLNFMMITPLSRNFDLLGAQKRSDSNLP